MTAPPAHAPVSVHDVPLVIVSAVLTVLLTRIIDYLLNVSGAKNSREARIDAKWQAYVDEQEERRSADKEEIASLRASYSEQVQLSNRLLKRLDEVTAELDALKQQGDVKDVLIAQKDAQIGEYRVQIDRLRKEKDETAASHARAIRQKDATIKTLQSAKAEAQAQAADMEKRLRAEIDRLQGEIDQLKAQIAPAAVAVAVI